MAKETNIRFVRCPRCHEILPELQDYPLYRCGNCEIVIESKSRRTDGVKSEYDSAKTSLQESVLDMKEVGDSVDKDSLSNCEVMSMSEGPNSPDIACSRSVECDESLKLKPRGKSKLTEDLKSVRGAKNLLENENQESSLLLPEPNQNHFTYSKIVYTMDGDGASMSDPVVPPDSEIPLSESHVSLYLTSPSRDNDAPGFSNNGTDLSSEPGLKSNSISMYLQAGNYYAYDGSGSSCDDRKLDKFSRPLRKSRDPEYILSTRKRMNEAGSKVNKRLDPRSPEMDTCTGEDSIRLDKLENISTLQFATGDALDASDSESDKLDLLRRVWELKDQLNKMHFTKSQINTRLFPVQDQKHTPFADYPQFSRESARCVNHVSFPCLQCYPRDLHLQRSAQLPSHHKTGRHSVHSDHTCCDISYSTNYNGNNLSKWDNPAKEMKLKRMSQPVMKHTLPVAGGAPFIACYYCWKLLEIPSEFVLFRRQYHKIMCGACNKILRFSLHQGTHLAPYTPKTDQLSSPNSHSEERKNSHSKETISGISSEGAQDGKKPFFNKSLDKKDSLMEHTKLVASSSEKKNNRKIASDGTEAPEPSNSPLHHLMGYSSVSQVFRS